MTEPLSFEEWKDKCFKVNDGVVETLKKIHNQTDEQIAKDFDYLQQESYKLYKNAFLLLECYEIYEKNKDEVEL
jgi:hypothetical protein